MHGRKSAVVWIGLLVSACAVGAGSQGSTHAEEPNRSDDAPGGRVDGGPAEPVSRGDIPVWEEGRQTGFVDRTLARERGLTIVDLGDEWTPKVFHEDPSLGRAGRQPYRAQLIRLQNEATREARRDPTERYLELFGIFPTLDVLRKRLADAERHTCHAAVDNAPIEALESALRPGAQQAQQRRRANTARGLRRRLEGIAARRNLSSIDELEDDRRYGSDLRRLREMESEMGAIRAVQAHLSCENFLFRRATEGVLDAWTGRAIRAWQSKHMIISLASRLDEATRATLVMDSRELDFLSLLRSLRERVVDASGVIEDGTASNQWGTVLGRQLQVDDEFRWNDRLSPLEGGAPDLVSIHTEAAARALGWTSPEAALTWLNEHHPERMAEHLVALPLPAPPDYHSEHMDLRVEIDRGDVWYAFPYTDDGRPRGFRVNRRPTLVIYARHGNRETPLVRWNTTIGSWQPERNPQGGIGMRYKESDVGPRVWRDMIASPAWLPPPSTPDRELLRGRRGNYRVNTSITGPGYNSAYGLAMVIHHLVTDPGTENEAWVDRGIRSHGSVSYRSILRGYSHGCHRLFNHLAVRMMSFLLNHRNHVVRGRLPASLRRELQPPVERVQAAPADAPTEGATAESRIEGAATPGTSQTQAAAAAAEPPREPLILEIDTRGYLFELTPPVPVEVLEGRVRGQPRRAPTAFFPLPEELQAQAREQIEQDPSPGE